MMWKGEVAAERVKSLGSKRIGFRTPVTELDFSKEGRKSRQVQMLEEEAVFMVKIPPSYLMIFCLSLFILPHQSLDGRDHDLSTGSLSTRFGR